MKVSEVLRRLSKLDPDHEVYVMGPADEGDAQWDVVEVHEWDGCAVIVRSHEDATCGEEAEPAPRPAEPSGPPGETTCGTCKGEPLFHEPCGIPGCDHEEPCAECSDEETAQPNRSSELRCPDCPHLDHRSDGTRTGYCLVKGCLCLKERE